MNLKNWEMELDLTIANDKHSTNAYGSLQLFLLRDNPQRSASEFAKGLSFLFSGFMIGIKENINVPNKEDVKYCVIDSNLENIIKQSSRNLWSIYR